MGNTELIKDWAFTGGRPARPLALPTGLGTAPSVAFPDQPVLGVGLSDSCPSPYSAQAYVTSSPLWGQPVPKDLLEKKGSWWGKTQVVPAPHIPVCKAIVGALPFGTQSWV